MPVCQNACITIQKVILVDRLALHLYVQEVPDSILDLKTDYRLRCCVVLLMLPRKMM